MADGRNRRMAESKNYKPGFRNAKRGNFWLMELEYRQGIKNSYGIFRHTGSNDSGGNKKAPDEGQYLKWEIP